MTSHVYYIVVAGCHKDIPVFVLVAGVHCIVKPLFGQTEYVCITSQDSLIKWKELFLTGYF